MILAGDIGGTKTLLGIFDPQGGRPLRRNVRAYPTKQYGGLDAIIDEFLTGHEVRPPVTAAAFGVAGPVIHQVATMTNVSWRVDGAAVARHLGNVPVRLLNDLEAMAHGLLVLEPAELKTLQVGVARRGGNVALIAAGTGLGQALLHEFEGRYHAVASEGGHADFAARTDRELELVRMLRARFGRAEQEHVLSGPGLLNLAVFSHAGGRCEAAADGRGPTQAADVSVAALEGRCPRCVEALEMFVSAYGAVAANLALTAVSTGGVYIGGGIAPKILPAFDTPHFIQAFVDKGPMRPLLETMPVHVILNPECALLGAAVAAGTTTA
ncbi:MAG: glucokinase [Acidobacteriota bacterium]